MINAPTSFNKNNLSDYSTLLDNLIFNVFNNLFDLEFLPSIEDILYDCIFL